MSLKDESRVKEFLTKLESIDKKQVSIGIQGKEAEEYHVDPVTGKKSANMVVIAGANEFGATTSKGVKIPERSFIRGTYDTKKEDIVSFMNKYMPSVIDGDMKIETLLENVGKYGVSLTQEFLTDLKTPPNAPSTIKAKNGKTNPLIDTGRLRDTITWKVGDSLDED